MIEWKESYRIEKHDDQVMNSAVDRKWKKKGTANIENGQNK